MLTIKRRNLQFSVMAAAVLAVVALAAVMLLSGGNAAQATATTETLALASDGGGDGNPLSQQQEKTPHHATPEPCPGETGNTNPTAASVIDSGQFALFDVWWNPDEGELTNTVCPPKVEYVPEDDDEGTPARTDRASSSIDITAEPPTIIHIPRSARIDLSASTTYTKAKYKHVWDADAAENRDTDNDGTPDGVGDGIVWALPACPTDGATFSGLCLSFSAALLNSEDWLDPEGGADGAIDYLVHHVHQVDIDKQDPRYVLVYDAATVADKPLWNSHDAREGKVTVAPGEYNNPLWFFTDRGAYEFQVNIQGYPDTAKDNPVSKDPSVTSDVREYILHVGAEADLSATMMVAPESPSPGVDNVTVTITAGNASGKDEAQKTEVDINLPEGLTYSSHSPATDTVTESEGVWTWDAGRMDPGASKTLTITATVDRGTHGKQLDVVATVFATEPLKITETVVDEETGEPVIDKNTGKPVERVVTHHVPVPDPDPTNNTAMRAITVASISNVSPLFQITRSVPENSLAETLVGDPIAVREPNSDDTLTFGVTGDGAHNFTASSVSDGAQIAVASGAYLDY